MTLHLVDSELAMPRAVRLVPDQLGNYIRPAYGDRKALEQALAEERGTGSGLVINPVHMKQLAHLVFEANSAGVETVLDPRSLELSTATGRGLRGMDTLPWAGERPHAPADLKGRRGADFVQILAEKATLLKFTAILAPAHLVAGLQTPWLEVDAELTRQLRVALDDAGGAHIRIYFPLMMRAGALRTDIVRQTIRDQLSGLPIDAVWLRLHPFGTTSSGPLAVKNYLGICRSLRSLDVPIVADQSGAVGVALLAFEAVGGVESGVTFKDKVDLESMTKPLRPGQGGFGRRPRVYLDLIDAFIELDRAAEFFHKRGMFTSHACSDSSCCPHGWRDMIADPKCHFLRQQAREVSGLSSAPQIERAKFYMDHFLRPAAELAARAAQVEPSLVDARVRLEGWKRALDADLRSPASTHSRSAAGRLLRRTA